MSQARNHLTSNSCLSYLLLGFISAISCFSACSPSENDVHHFYTYHIINAFPHDDKAFTQGLVVSDGFFYESTGLYGASSVRKVDPITGNSIKRYELPNRFFGEGLTIVGNEIIQLTWRSRVGFVYDKDTFAVQKEFNYQTEGWGITYDGKRLIMSDGTATLYFLDPETLKTIAQIEVFDEDGSVTRLNELEFIKGEIYANIWGSDHIVRINPQTGRVVAWIDLTGLLPPEDRTRPVEVLNGIAYDAQKDRIFVTGKLWPKVFQIELIPIEDS
jgi:glutamine cyclotransferase